MWLHGQRARSCNLTRPKSWPTWRCDGAWQDNNMCMFAMDVLRCRHSRGGTAYLGRQLTFDNFHYAEIKSRISKGWACNRHHLPKSRLKLFDAVVSATMLYGSGAWTKTVEREHLLQVARRRMLTEENRAYR